MACDPIELFNDARCFTCLQAGQLEALIAYLLCQIKDAVGGTGTNVKPAIAVCAELGGAPQTQLSGIAQYPSGVPTTFVKAIVWAYPTNTAAILLAPYNAPGLADSNMQPVLPNQFYTIDNDGRIADLADHGIKSSAAFGAVVYYWYPL